jgi:hypothetical protein
MTRKKVTPRDWVYWNILGRFARPLRRAAIPALYHTGLDGWLASTATSAVFVRDHLSLVPQFRSRFELLRHCIQSADYGGIILEFGVWQGESLSFILKTVQELGRSSAVVGFDSFKGLSRDWRRRFERGTFAVETSPAPILGANIVKGWFEETVRPFLSSNTRPVTFVHFDADLYESTLTVLNELHAAGCIRPGLVMDFDDLYNYPRWYETGEYRALFEFSSKANLTFDYFGYVPTGTQVAIRVRTPNESTPRKRST